MFPLQVRSLQRGKIQYYKLQHFNAYNQPAAEIVFLTIQDTMCTDDVALLFCVDTNVWQKITYHL